MLPVLPPEVIGAMAKYLSPGDLASLALTTHANQREAERVLYRTVELEVDIDSETRRGELEAALHRLHVLGTQDRLASAVRKFGIVVVPKPEGGYNFRSEENSSLLCAAICHVLPKMAYLQDLDIRVGLGENINSAILGILR